MLVVHRLRLHGPSTVRHALTTIVVLCITHAICYCRISVGASGRQLDSNSLVKTGQAFTDLEGDGLHWGCKVVNVDVQLVPKAELRLFGYVAAEVGPCERPCGHTGQHTPVVGALWRVGCTQLLELTSWMLPAQIRSVSANQS